MLARNTGLVASLALVANALLLPPGVSLEAASSLDPASTFNVDPNHQNVRVDCTACAFATSGDNDKLVWAEDVDNELVFEFDTGADRDSINVNGARLFPPSLSVVPDTIYVHQVPTGVDLATFKEAHPRHIGLRVTGYEFRFDSAETISEDGNELLPMTLTVKTVAFMPVPAYTLRIFAIKDTRGHLSIASITTVAVPEHEQEQECTERPIICRLRAFVETKLDSLRRPSHKPGCPGMSSHHGAGRPHREGKPPYTMRPHHHNHDGHRHMRHHSKLHRFLHGFKRVMLTVIVPILVGIVAGMLTYLIGMMIGAAAGMFWMKVCGREGPYQRIALDEEDAGSDTDDDIDVKYGKEVYIVEEIAEVEGEAPPAYRDVDGEEKEVVV